MMSVAAAGEVEFNACAMSAQHANPNVTILLCTEAIEAGNTQERTAMAYALLSRKFYEKRDFKIAITNATMSIRLDPKEKRGYSLRATAYRAAARYSEAIADYDKVVAIDPDDAGAFYGRGRAYEELPDFERAIADYDKAIQLDLRGPDGIAAMLRRAFAYEMKGDKDRAAADYGQVLALDPKNKNAADGLKALGLSVAPGPITVQSDPFVGCRRTADVDRSIRACSEIIAAGKEPPDRLAVAYANRGARLLSM
jgi:tetratricopeptide (TPR) repeat protein